MTKPALFSLQKPFVVLCTISVLAISGSISVAQTGISLLRADTLQLKAESTDTILADIAPRATDPDRAIREEMGFIEYLVSSELYTNASQAIGKIDPDKIQSTDLRDSLLYFNGWIAYFNQHFDDATAEFSKISPTSKIYTQSAFYKSISHVYLQEYDSAKYEILQLKAIGDDQYHDFADFQLAGIALLQRDYAAYDSIASQFAGKNYAFASEEKELNSLADSMMQYKRKSAFLAGFLSALLPGMGKFYAGYKGTPFGALVTNLPLAAVAVECFIIGGALSVPFLITAPIFGVFYIGNIWGSALSVYAHEKEFYDEMDHNILYDLHIPIRRVFN